MEPSVQDPATSAPTEQKLGPGVTIDGFVLQRRIGAGGMGEVFEGLQPLIGKRVAIKVLREGTKEEGRGGPILLAEARAAASVRHRGIVDIYNLGELPDGRHYLVMELLEGHSLDRLLAELGPFPVDEALDLLDELLEALEAVHAAGVLHRDLKPSNVFRVSPPSGTPYTKLLDFGLARPPDPAAPRSRLVSGTPPYLAPEQLRGEAATVSSDLYAFGTLAFELLTARKAFPGEPTEVIAQQRGGVPQGGVADIPAAVAVLLLKILSYEPAARPKSAREVQIQLRQVRSSLNEVASFEMDRLFDESSRKVPAVPSGGSTRQLDAAPAAEAAKPKPSEEEAPPVDAGRRMSLPEVVDGGTSRVDSLADETPRGPVRSLAPTPPPGELNRIAALIAASLLGDEPPAFEPPVYAEPPPPEAEEPPGEQRHLQSPANVLQHKSTPLVNKELTLTPVSDHPAPPPAPVEPPPAPPPTPSGPGRLARALSSIGKLFARTPKPPEPAKPAPAKPAPAKVASASASAAPPAPRAKGKPPPPPAETSASPLSIELDLDDLELTEPSAVAELAPERLLTLTEAVVEHLGKTAQLPAFPSAAGRILSLLSSPDVDVGALVKIVGQDPVLTTQVMRMANSAMVSRGNEIKTVRDAVTRLGLRDVAGAATAAATMALFDKQLKGRGPACDRLRRQIFTLSLATGFSAAWLSMEHRLGDSDQAFLAGLLHDLGKSLALAALADPALSRRLGLAPDSPELEPVLEAVHTELGARMAELWVLPEIVVLVCREHHEPTPGPAVKRELHVVRLVAALAEMRFVQAWPRERLEEVRSSAAVLGLNRHQLRATSTQVRQLLERAKSLVAAGGG